MVKICPVTFPLARKIKAVTPISDAIRLSGLFVLLKKKEIVTASIDTSHKVNSNFEKYEDRLRIFIKPPKKHPQHIFKDLTMCTRMLDSLLPGGNLNI